ncbi:hypothetical protein KCP69_08390 [Salmonella enterica subsp. enterica]|nr:hypothetical protein KCP69_08390 [Salmonella enterica subsp. enterica]
MVHTAPEKKCIRGFATSDFPSTDRFNENGASVTVAEYFRDEENGSCFYRFPRSRACVARDVALASGERPARRGYPPPYSMVCPLAGAPTGRPASITWRCWKAREEADRWRMKFALSPGGHLYLKSWPGGDIAAAIDVAESVSRVLDKSRRRRMLNEASPCVN